MIPLLVRRSSKSEGGKRGIYERPFFTIIILALSLYISGCANNISPSDEGYSRTIPFLGSFLEIKVYDKDIQDKDYRKKVEESVDEAIAIGMELEKKFSIYMTDSEINILNSAKKMKVSDELYEMLKFSNEVSAITAGEFDPTVAPVLKKAGFYARIPKEVFDGIPDTYYEGHWKDIELLSDNEVILNNDAWIDLGGIATGYIVDKMSAFLLVSGVKFFLINSSGDIYATEKEDGGKISIGIREPGTDDIVIVLNIKNESVVTSGDYENWLIDKNTDKPVTHIVNPATGDVLGKELAGFTVIAGSAVVADGLSTGMMAMGAEKAIKLANDLDGAELVVVTYKNGKIDVKFSKGVEGRYIEEVNNQ